MVLEAPFLANSYFFNFDRDQALVVDYESIICFIHDSSTRAKVKKLTLRLGMCTRTQGRSEGNETIFGL